MEHELWIAVVGKVILGFTMLGRADREGFKIMYLEVAPPQKSRGVGSGLIQAVLAHYPNSEFPAIPFEGTEDFYRRLGFEKVSKCEMRRPASS